MILNLKHNYEKLLIHNILEIGLSLFSNSKLPKIKREDDSCFLSLRCARWCTWQRKQRAKQMASSDGQARDWGNIVSINRGDCTITCETSDKEIGPNIKTTHHGYVDPAKRKQYLSGSWFVDRAKGKQYRSSSWLIVSNVQLRVILGHILKS